jgi:ElaB/YqjD/DUF883 family membrane-anchored ribosome-binding protein
MGKNSDEIREQIEELRDRMAETVDAPAYRADVPNCVSGKLNDRVAAVKSTITGTIQTVRERTTSVRENPFGIFFGAAAVGFLIGLLVPATGIENEKLGKIGTQLKQRSRAAGVKIIEQAKDAVFDSLMAGS